MMWPPLQDVLKALHGLPHLSAALHSIPNEFSLSEEYVQSQMLMVVLVLVVGFSLLLLLAVLMCALISFVRPVGTPPMAVRLGVLGVALGMAVTSSYAAAFNGDFACGLDALIHSLEDVHALATNVGTTGGALRSSSEQLDSTVARLAACCGCPPLDAPPRRLQAATQEAARSGPSVRCEALALRREVARASAEFASDTGPAAAHVDHVIDSLRHATNWHLWLSTLPHFAALVVGSAVAFGVLAGMRSLLVGAQFSSVIMWWLLCAISGVQLAVSVHSACGCGAHRRSTFPPSAPLPSAPH